MYEKKLEFELVVERIKKQFLYKTDKKFADAIGMSPAAFNNRKNTASLPYQEIIAFANKNNLNLNWVLTGDGPVRNEEKQRISGDNITKVIVEHQDLVARFKNQKRAKEINERLIEIEEASDELIDKADVYIKGLYDASKVIKGLKKTPNDGEDIQDKSTG